MKKTDNEVLWEKEEKKSNFGVVRQTFTLKL